MEELAVDVRHAITLLEKSQASKGTNDISTDLRKVEAILKQSGLSHKLNETQQSVSTVLGAGQVLTVRSTVPGGQAKQLFTGLRKKPTDGIKVEAIDIRKLPNGFDVVNANFSAPAKSDNDTPRTFAQVFGQTKNVRDLELPKKYSKQQGNKLFFENPLEHVSVSDKDDFRHASLSAGSWLDYSTASSDPTNTAKTAPKEQQDVDALFRSAFSSFAPAQDNTNATISTAHRSRRWYRRHGFDAMRKIFSISDVEPDQSEYPDIGDDFQQVIDDLGPSTPEDANLETNQDDDSNDVIAEISDLLQTLSSYQEIRDLERDRSKDSASKPSEPEVEVYDLLKQQLKLLVGSLPPFAVAKLDGKQLEQLNISTNIIVSTPDIAGTGQPDEGTLSRQRQALAQQAALARPVPAQSYRGGYAASPAASYTAQNRNYSATQTPSMPGYAQRNAQTYSTPRPPLSNVPNQQTAYQRSQPLPNATIQQWQRMQNGTLSPNQTPYQQRTGQTQPQTAQSTPRYAQGTTPAKPTTNGQHTNSAQTYQPRTPFNPAAGNAALLQGSYAQANAHATIQQIKAAQAGNVTTRSSVSQSPQPGTGTPQPAALNGVPGQIGPIVRAGSQNVTTPTAVAGST